MSLERKRNGVECLGEHEWALFCFEVERNQEDLTDLDLFPSDRLEMRYSCARSVVSVSNVGARQTCAVALPGVHGRSIRIRRQPLNNFRMTATEYHTCED